VQSHGLVFRSRDDIPLVGEEQSDDDSELLSEREALLRSQVYDNRISLVPSFSYESILEDLDGSEGVERIGAEPADSELGDRLAIFAASETATTLKTVLTEKWGDPSSSQEYVTSVDDQRVPFDLSAGSEIAIGATVRDSQSTNLTELLVARGTNESVVEDLIDNFTPFYLDIVP